MMLAESIRDYEIIGLKVSPRHMLCLPAQFMSEIFGIISLTALPQTISLNCVHDIRKCLATHSGALDSSSTSLSPHPLW